MKQIFDWLREQIEEEKEPEYENADAYYNQALNVAISKVDEAEAKWEQDCCEWKPYGKKEFIENPHTRRMFSNEPSMKNVYCNTCGKPIKISEVE